MGARFCWFRPLLPIRDRDLPKGPGHRNRSAQLVGAAAWMTGNIWRAVVVREKKRGQRGVRLCHSNFAPSPSTLSICPLLPLGWNGILHCRLFCTVCPSPSALGDSDPTFPSHISSHASIGSRSRARSPRQCQCAEGNHQAAEHMSASVITPCTIGRGPPRIVPRSVT